MLLNLTVPSPKYVCAQYSNNNNTNSQFKLFINSKYQYKQSVTNLNAIMYVQKSVEIAINFNSIL